MATKPSRQDINALAEQRTASLGYPKEPTGTAALGDLDLYRRRRDELYERQLRNAESELTRRYERDQADENDRAARDQARTAEREALLRGRFDRRFPGGSDADFAALRPTLLSELSAEADQVERDALDLARSRVRI